MSFSDRPFSFDGSKPSGLGWCWCDSRGRLRPTVLPLISQVAPGIAELLSRRLSLLTNGLRLLPDLLRRTPVEGR
jgi:hypothetical protein